LATFFSLSLSFRAKFLYAPFFGDALLAVFLLGLFFNPEDEGDMFVQSQWNFGKLNQYYLGIQV
jgi:hypothetical protein